MTCEATGAQEDTIIIGNWDIGNDDITIDGFTIQGEMYIDGEDVLITDVLFEKSDDSISEVLVTYEYDGTGTSGGGVIKDSVFDTTEGSVDDTGLFIWYEGLSGSGNTFIVDEDDVAIEIEYDSTVKDNTFTGNSGTGIYWDGGIGIVTGNTFDGLENAIYIDWADEGSEITGNTIMNSTGDAIYVYGTYDIIITNNTITGTDEDFYALSVDNNASGEVYMLFNNITGNELNVMGELAGTVVNATHNWWGDAAGTDSDSITEDPGTIDNSSYLGAAVTSAAVVLGVADLDAETAVGVSVEDATGATIIGVASYGGNPQEAIADDLAFFDVFVADATAAPTVKFYAGNGDTVINAWSAATDIWAAQDTDFSAFGGYVYATISLDLLEGTPIALIDSPVAGTLDRPLLASPVSGDVTVSLTPTFSWGEVTDADAYYLQIADNPAFLLPLASLTGDLGRLLSTTYAQVADLDYSDVIYWSVKAVSGTTGGGDLIESIWADDVFTTMEEPLEEV